MAIFDFETIHEKYDNANLVEKIVKNKVIHVKDITEASQYMIKHFFPLTTGEHLFLKDTNKNDAMILSDKSSSTYFKKIPDAVVSWYLKDYLRLYEVINDINKPFGPIDKQSFNVCNGLLHKTYKKFEEYPEHIKACVYKLLFHVKDVMCDGKEDSYIYIVKWIANMCRGNKNDSVIYLRSPEGTGKSVIFDFITDYVLGRKACKRYIRNVNNRF